MNFHRTRSFCVVALAMGLAAPAVAQVGGTQDNTAYGGTAGEFLLLGAGARGAALGGSFAALVTDVTALYYNPGGLAQMTRPQAMVSSYSYVADTRYTWAGVGFPFAGGVRSIGLSLGTFGFADQPIYTIDNPDGDGRTYAVAQTFVGLTYGQNFSDRFAAGLTLKYIRDDLGDVAGSTVAVDFGTSFHASIGDRPIRAAFVLSNLGGNIQHDGPGLDAGSTREPPLGTPNIPQEEQPARLRTSPWGLPVLFRVSAAFDVVNLANNRVSLLGEFSQPNNTKPNAGFGAEWAYGNLGNSGFGVALRGSYTIQPDNQVDDINFAGLPTSESDGSFTADGLALGGGLDYSRGNYRVGFDYAYKNMGTLGATNYLSFSLGW